MEKQARIVVKPKEVSQEEKQRKAALLAQYANVTDEEEYPFPEPVGTRGFDGQLTPFQLCRVGSGGSQGKSVGAPGVWLPRAGAPLRSPFAAVPTLPGWAQSRGGAEEPGITPRNWAPRSSLTR